MGWRARYFMEELFSTDQAPNAPAWVKIRRGSGTAPNALARTGHGSKKFGVGLRFGEASQEQLHGLDGRERIQHLAKHPYAIEFIGRHQQFFFPGAGTVDVNGREDALV